MYNICLRMMRSSADAEDMLQESFFQVFKSIAGFREESTIGAWIKRIVVNKCLNQLKKKKWQFADVEAVEAEEEAPVDEEKFAYTVERIQAAIGQLADGYRVVFTLYMFEGYSHKQIAEQLDLSVSTVKTQYMRAKQKIRALVEAEAMQEGS